MGNLITQAIGGFKMVIEVCETENPPILIKKDEEKVFLVIRSLEDFALRKRVYDMLVVAKTKLPQGIYFKCFESYRPIKTQIKYWEETLELVKGQFPTISKEELYERADVLCANPYENGSGHQTGGAIDLGLCDGDGNELDMGTEWRNCTDLVRTYRRGMTQKQYENRGILLDAMLYAGFSNYFEEWWHFCYGDLDWAVMNRIPKTLFARIEV
jgi:D-alanyl-D-alanine dipeptidase